MKNSIWIFTICLFVFTVFIFTSCPEDAPPRITPTSNITAVPAAGSLARGTPVTLSCSIEGVELWYTIDGSDPVAGTSGNINIVAGRTSIRYTSPIIIGDDMTITVIARSSGSNVDYIKLDYTINQSLSGELLYGWTKRNQGTNYSWDSSSNRTPSINGKTWFLSSGLPMPEETNMHWKLESSGLFIFNGRILIGVDNNSPVTGSNQDPITHHGDGEFNLKEAGSLRLTITYVNQGYGTGTQTNPLALYLNNNTNNVNYSVHTSSLGSRVSSSEPQDLPVTLIWDINLKELTRLNTTSKEALGTSFFQIYGGNGPTLIDSFFIEYKAPPALVQIEIQGEDTVQESTPEVTRQIPLTAIQTPVEADVDILWSISNSSVYSENTEVTGIASINPDTGVLTGLGVGEVWVFAKGIGTAITTSKKITVTEFAYINATGISINTTPSDAATLMSGDGTSSNPGKTLSFTASPIPWNTDDGPFTWVWSLRTGEASNSELVDSAIAALSTSGTIRTLTAVFTEEPVDVWVHVRNTTPEISSARKITILPFEEADWELVWEWKKEDMTTPITISNASATTINGIAWRKFNAQGGSTIAGPDGLVLGQNQRLFIGTNSNTVTSTTSYHTGGQFNLGTTGKARIRIIGTRTSNTFNVALNWSVNASSVGDNDTVHGAPASSWNITSSLAAGTHGLLINFEIDLEALAKRNDLSKEALSNSFFCLRSQNNAGTVITIDSITIEKAP